MPGLRVDHVITVLPRPALLFLSVLAMPALAQSPDLGPLADRVFADWTASTPGCAVGVAQHGRTLLEKAYGMANLETATPNAPRTIFESGSVAKQFTATAVLLLMHDGKLRMDDPVQKHIPELPVYDRPITLRHLVSHTSGLREWSNLVAVAGWPRGTRAHTQEDLLGYVFAQRALNYPVGDYYSYTNSGFALLQTIVERVSGMPFAQFSDERIFRPLGMTSTSWRVDFNRLVPGRAQAYERRGTQWALDMPFENVVGPGGLLTTVGDWLTWNNALDRKALGAWLVDSLESNGSLTSGRTIRYAMGVTDGAWRGEREVAHSGSTGGYSTYLMRLPERGISVAVLCNAAGAPATSYARQMAAALLPPAPAAVAPDTVAVSATTAASLTGVYKSRRTNEPLFVTPGSGRGGSGIRALRDGSYLIGTARMAADLRDPRRVILRQQTADGDSIEFEKVGDARWAPLASDLTPLEGAYHSSEVGVTWTATAEGSSLFLAGPRGSRRLLTPAYRDAFSAPGLGTVWFTRDPSGRAASMHISSARLWNLVLPRDSRP